MRWLEKYVIHDTSFVCLGFRLPWATGPQIWCCLPKKKEIKGQGGTAEEKEERRKEGAGENKFEKVIYYKAPMCKE